MRARELSRPHPPTHLHVLVQPLVLPSCCDGRWRGSWWLGGGFCVRGVRDSSRAEESL